MLLNHLRQKFSGTIKSRKEEKLQYITTGCFNHTNSHPGSSFHKIPSITLGSLCIVEEIGHGR